MALLPPPQGLTKRFDKGRVLCGPVTAALVEHKLKVRCGNQLQMQHAGWWSDGQRSNPFGGRSLPLPVPVSDATFLTNRENMRVLCGKTFCFSVLKCFVHVFTQCLLLAAARGHAACFTNGHSHARGWGHDYTRAWV